MAQPREVVEASTARLSRERYLAFLDEAKGRGFEFVCFRDFLPGAPPLPSRYIALRHDVDFAPEYSLEMAELDHDAGVASTFFVLLDGGFYNPLGSEIIEQIRRIHTLGHEVGLHFAVSSAVHADLGDEVAFRLRLLRDILGAPVRSFSQHDPANAGLANIDLPPGSEPCVDAYQVTREHDLLYVSESAMMWREHTFETALDSRLCHNPLHGVLAKPAGEMHANSFGSAGARLLMLSIDEGDEEFAGCRRAFRSFPHAVDVRAGGLAAALAAELAAPDDLTPLSLAAYARSVLAVNERHGRPLPDPTKTDWAQPEWTVLRLVAICSMAEETGSL